VTPCRRASGRRSALDVAGEAPAGNSAAMIVCALHQRQQVISPSWRRPMATGCSFGRAVAGLSRKCVVLDLDIPSGGGRDDAWRVCRVGQGSATVRPSRLFSAFCRCSARAESFWRCSKNDPTVAEPHSAGHTEMILKRAEIAASLQLGRKPQTSNMPTAQNIVVDSLFRR